MKLFPTALLAVLLATGSPAAETLTETQYFTEGFKPGLKVPTPASTWKIYRLKKISVGSKATSVEILEGPNRGTTIWAVGKHIVSIPKTGSPTVSEKTSGEAVLWETPETTITWFKGLEPTHKEKQNDREILVYESGGGFRRIWVDAKTQHPIAQTEGRFVTFYEQSQTDTDLEPPEVVKVALAENKKHEQKLGEYGAMPK